MRNPVILLLIAVSAALGVTGVARTPNLRESKVAGRPVQQHEDGYTSSDTCRSCHPSQFDSWHASYHRTMTQVATPQTAIPGFDGQTIADVQGKPMTLRERGTELWAEFDDPDSAEPPSGGRESIARSR